MVWIYDIPQRKTAMSEAAVRGPESSISVAPKCGGAIKYTMRGTQLLSGGMTTIPKASADNLWIHSKVYSCGGENDLHAHPDEDHTFFVLQGTANFEFGDGSALSVENFEGVLIPKGTLYRFTAAEEQNLVMLRIGGAQRGAGWSGEIVQGVPAEICRAIDKDGRIIFDTDKLKNKGKTPSEPVVPMPGHFFPGT